MAQAKRTGVVATLQIMKRTEHEMPEEYKRSLKLWRRTWQQSQKLKHEGDIDYFIPVCNIERHIKKNHHRIFFNTTLDYGNNDLKRVYTWDEGTIGLGNIALNLAGGLLRFLAMTRYPFPTPIQFPYRYRKIDGSIKEETGYGYPGSARSTKVVLAHPTIAPMDFVDMIRSPVQEIARQCIIYSVPYHEKSKYLNMTIYYLRPFLDHIYTRTRTGDGTKVGTNHYIEELDSILEKVIAKIRTNHNRANVTGKRLTNDLGVFQKQSQSLLALTDFHFDDHTKAIQEELVKLVTNNIIHDNDLKEFSKEILRKSSSRGNRFHRRISWGFTNPPTPASMILGGDYHARSDSGYQVFTDVPVIGGKGRADFVLCVRRSLEPSIRKGAFRQGFWKPVMVLDAKSKTAFDCGFVGKPITNQAKVVIDGTISARALHEEEWREAIENTPSRTELLQLKEYSRGLNSDYEELAGEPTILSTLMFQGNLVVDQDENPSKMRGLLPELLISIYETTRSRAIHSSKSENSQASQIFNKRIVFNLSDSGLRAAVVLHPIKRKSFGKLASNLPLPQRAPRLHLTPLFSNLIIDSTHLVLYVSAPTAQSQRAASWISRYWHGMEYCRKLKKKGTEVVWLDLAGEFSDPKIRDAFVRRYALGGSGNHHDRLRRRYIREFVRDINFIDLSDQAFGALHGGEEVLLSDEIEELTSESDLVIISGMDTLRNLSTKDVVGLNHSLTNSLIRGTEKKDRTVVWFDNAIQTASESEIYKRNRILPLAHNSPLNAHVDEIIINHHLPPLPGISQSPLFDTIRRIVKLTPNEYEYLGLTTVPCLKQWSARFRAERLRDIQKSIMYSKSMKGTQFSEVSVDSYSQYELNDLFSPLVLDNFITLFEPQEKNQKLVSSAIDLKIEYLAEGNRSSDYKGVLSRLNLSEELSNPEVRAAISRKKDAYFVPLDKVNNRRKYWNPRPKKEQAKSVFFAPIEASLVLKTPDLELAAKLEIERFFQAISVINSIAQNDAEIIAFCRKLVNRFNELQIQLGMSDKAIAWALADEYKHIDISRSIWWSLAYHRSDLTGHRLHPITRSTLKVLKERKPHSVVNIGNYFVLVLSCLQNKRGIEFSLQELHSLWDSIYPWLLLQLGAEQVNKDRTSVFNMWKATRELQSKVRALDSIPVPYIPPFNEVRYGIMADSHDPDDDAEKRFRWYLFEKSPLSTEMVAGCIPLKERKLGGTAVIPMDEQARQAKKCIAMEIIRPIMIGRVGNISILYIEDEEWEFTDAQNIVFDDVYWRPAGHLKYSTRHIQSISRLKWLNASYYAGFPITDSEFLSRRPEFTAQRMFEHLETISNRYSEIVRVTCTVSGTPSRGKIMFSEKEGKDIGSIKFSNLQIAKSILRNPYDIGIPLALNSQLLTWDPTSDIEYSKEMIDIENDVIANIRFEEP